MSLQVTTLENPFADFFLSLCVVKPEHLSCGQTCGHRVTRL